MQVPVTGGCSAPTASIAVTTSMDGTARVWQVPTGTPVVVDPPCRPGARWSSARTAGRLVTVAATATARTGGLAFFALPVARFLHELAARGVQTASFSPDGAWSSPADRSQGGALGGRERQARPRAGQAPRGGHRRRVRPSRSPLATASTDGATRVWDVRTGVRVAQMLGHSMGVSSVSFSSDGAYLVTASSDGTARVLGGGHRPAQVALRGHTAAAAVVDASFSPDGQGGRDCRATTARLGSGTRAPPRSFVSSRRPEAAAGRGLRPDGRRSSSPATTGRPGSRRPASRSTLRHPAPVTSAAVRRGRPSRGDCGRAAHLEDLAFRGRGDRQDRSRPVGRPLSVERGRPAACSAAADGSIRFVDAVDVLARAHAPQRQAVLPRVVQPGRTD